MILFAKQSKILSLVKGKPLHTLVLSCAWKCSLRLQETTAAHTLNAAHPMSLQTAQFQTGRYDLQSMLLKFVELCNMHATMAQVSYMELKDATESRYYKYRESQLLNLDDTTM